MPSDDVCLFDLLEIGRRVQARQISSVEVTQAVLDRIAGLDGRLKSYVTVTADLAQPQARQADTEIARAVIRGPLHGVPIAVKDLFHTKGIPTSAGMTIHKDFRPEHDATVVTRLREAGAVLLGKLKLTEGAFAAHHPLVDPPINPWSAVHWTGASSSGSGVATAAGLCYGSLGTDTVGSIRYPSAMNGITGLKPTWGRVSRAGVFSLAPSLDHVGPMTRSAADAAAMLGVIAGADPDDPTAIHEPVPDYLAGIAEGIRGLRIGIDRALIAAGADADTVRATEEGAAVLTRKGALMRDVSFPSPDAIARDARALCAAEAAVMHEATYPSRAAEYGPVLAALLDTGRSIDGLAVAKILHRRQTFLGQLNTLFKDIDLLIMPVMQRAAPSLADVAVVIEVSRRFITPFNMSGHPTLTLPGGKTADGLPVGFQIVGRHVEEGLVLRAGHAFQQETDWHRRRPPVD